MALKLSKSDLPQLLSWLTQHLPRSYKLHEELKSHLDGLPLDLEFYVDRWPDPQAAVSIVNSTGEQVKCMKFLHGMVSGLFGLTGEAVTALLKDNDLVNWDKSFRITAVADSLWPAVEALTGETWKSDPPVSSYLLMATPADVKPLPVPEGIKMSSISEEHISVVQKTWKYSAEGADNYVRALVRHNPSVIMFTDSGEHVGHMLGYGYGSLGMLFVQPQFRRKGYAKVIITQLAQKYFDSGKTEVCVYIEEENLHSISLHQSVGFKIVPDLKLRWLN